MSNGISMERVEEIIDGYDCQVHRSEERRVGKEC